MLCRPKVEFSPPEFWAAREGYFQHKQPKMAFHGIVETIPGNGKDEPDALTTSSSSGVNPYWQPAFLPTTPVSTIFEQETGGNGW
jgi:hypothetical protein